MRELPSQEFLRECFEYNQETGALTWRERPRHHFAHLPPSSSERVWKIINTRLAGKLAGTLHPRDGYTVVNFIWIGPVAAHRLIWKWMTGEDVPEVDHRDTDRTNNRWSNLRPATRQQNQQNRSVSARRAGKLKGATLHKISGRYFARIKVDGKSRYLGFFGTEGEAHAAYCAAAREAFGEFWNPG